MVKMVECYWCASVFELRPCQKLVSYRTGKPVRLFCSGGCRSAWRSAENVVPRGSRRSDVFKKKLSQLLRKKYRSGEVKHGCVGKPRHESTKRKLSDYWNNVFSGPNGFAARSKISNGVKKWYAALPVDVKLSMANAVKLKMHQYWNDPIYVERMRLAINLKPNQVELKAEKILSKYGFRYVGDFRFWIGGKNPDFVNEKNMVVVEIFGRWYHECSEVDERISHFKKYGYRTYIFWDDELGQMESIIRGVI